MSNQTTEKTVGSLELSIRYDDGSEQSLAQAELETAVALQAPIKGLPIQQLTSLKQECFVRGLAADRVRQLYERANAGKEFVRRAFRLWALNYQQIGRIVQEIMERKNKSLRAASIELEMKEYEAKKCLRLAQTEDLEQQIKDFDPDLNYSQDAFMRVITPSKAKSDTSALVPPGRLVTDPETGKIRKASPAEIARLPKPDAIELVALNNLLDQMYQNPEYFLGRKYQEEPSFKKRIEVPEMRERYQKCLSVLLRLLK